MKEGEGKLKKGSGVWKSLSSTLLGGVGLRSRQSDEYKKAVAKVEEVCSSVSIFYCCYFSLVKSLFAGKIVESLNLGAFIDWGLRKMMMFQVFVLLVIQIYLKILEE